MKKNIIPFLVLLLVASACEQKKPQAENPVLGDLQHNFDIEPAAQDAFTRGLLLLHSFEYDDAREAFAEARQAAPDELMTYWGEAMTHYKALWGLQDVDAGRKVISLAGPDRKTRLARASDDLEAEFWEGVEILYGEGELMERNKLYSAHMAEMFSDYSGNQEVAAFYALGLMWSADPGDNSNALQSAGIAKGILAENPNHPGALHYMIHAYDDPSLADKAESAADKYSQVAPDATHALHMPSHIYLAMGMWNNVVASNETSYAASVSRMERKGLGDEARGYHSYAWLHYGYLQQRRFADADQLLADMYEYEELAGTQAARSYLILMQNFQRIETGELSADWKRNIAYADLGLASKAGVHFLNALMAFDQGDRITIDLETDTLEMHIAAAELLVTEDGLALCSAGPTRYAPNKNDIIRAHVMSEEMRAMEDLLLNDPQAAEEHMKMAVKHESELGPPIGPPDIVYPSYDMYGYWLLEQDRPEEALKLFNNGLKRTPNKRMTLEGRQKALVMLGRDDEANEVANILAAFTREYSAS